MMQIIRMSKVVFELETRAPVTWCPRMFNGIQYSWRCPRAVSGHVVSDRRWAGCVWEAQWGGWWRSECWRQWSSERFHQQQLVTHSVTQGRDETCQLARCRHLPLQTAVSECRLQPTRQMGQTNRRTDVKALLQNWKVNFKKLRKLLVHFYAAYEARGICSWRRRKRKITVTAVFCNVL